MTTAPQPKKNDDGTAIRIARDGPWSHTLPPGTWLEGLEITGLIGEGGFGIVYLAYDASLERQVAVKEYMPSSLAGRAAGTWQVSVKSERHRDTFESGLKSFVNEARLLARFDHPALVKVFRFWEANGTAYMAMPYYEGPTLKSALAALGGPPDEAQLRAWLRPLLEALSVLHKEQCFHRDIAPDNILLTTRGPLLLDFGAARRLIGDMTHALTVVLKPGYAPIEQYGEAAAMVQGPWTDLYALASVVHYAITGQAPTSSVERIMEDTLQPLAQRAAGRYSDGFLKAIDRALAVRPTERPQDVAQFCAMLNAGVPADSPELFRTTDVRSSRYQSSDVDTQTVEPTRQRTSPPPATRTETLAAQCLETVPAPPVYVAAAAAPGSASRSRGTLLVAAVLGVLVVMGGAMVAIRSIGPSNDAARNAARNPVPPASKPVVPLPPAAESVPTDSAAPARVAVDRAPPGIAGTSAAWPPDKPVAIPVPPRLPTRAAVEASTPNRGMKPVRCSDILQRASLEPLTAEEAAYLRRECR